MLISVRMDADETLFTTCFYVKRQQQCIYILVSTCYRSAYLAALLCLPHSVSGLIPPSASHMTEHCWGKVNLIHLTLINVRLDIECICTSSSSSPVRLTFSYF
ncbi:hypothetical protein CHARACLAT_030332 [Characodon lateralis]|uniref:Uncharacterized protein n=1 Tax=Characodon lateralis TaxID=208331 RepID=A0ABU7F993_9TELE|nr:hypothetical protein [Characodon lateralis]